MLLAQHRQRAERDLQGEQHEEQRRGPPQLRARSVMEEDVTRRRDREERHDERADPMREVHGDLRVPRRWKQVTESQREVRYGESRIGVAHRRADNDLQVHEAGRRRRDALQDSIVG